MSGVDLAFQRLSRLITTKASSYATAYPNIRTVTKYMTVRLFAIDGNGKQVSHEVINALYHPNKSDSPAFAREDSYRRLAYARHIFWYGATIWSSKAQVILWGRAARILLVSSFLSFRELNELATRQIYTVGTQTFTEDMLVLPAGRSKRPCCWVACCLKPTPVGDAR